MSARDDRRRRRETERYRELLEASLEAPSPYPARRFSGRGIVLCAGGDVYFPCAWVNIHMLRRSGCTLPIELWYRGRREMTPEMIALVEPLGVACVDAYAVARRRPYRRLDSWQIKPFAIAWSRFEEVLYLDADNVALRNPEFLFETDAYRRTGAIFWPDRSTYRLMHPAGWDVCGLPRREEPELESGQLVIDKRRTWRALQMTLHLNSHSDFYYRFFYGDKDTFHLSWRRTGTRYTLVPHPVRHLDPFHTLIQHDLEGRPLFQHRIGHKWSIVRRTVRVPGFRDEEACLRILRNLKRRWTPPVRRLPDELSASESRIYAGICETRDFDYTAGNSTRRIQLLPDFRIGDDRPGREVGWMIEDDPHGRPVLSLRQSRGPLCFLRRGPGNAWRGRWLFAPALRVTLRAAR